MCFFKTPTQAVPVTRQNTFVELDAQLLDRIQLTTEDMARNATKEFVDHEIRAMIDLFLKNLNITIDEVWREPAAPNLISIGGRGWGWGKISLFTCTHYPGADLRRVDCP